MNNIAKFRESLGITQNQLAQLLGWTQGRIGNYELGLRVPSLSDSRKIVAILNQQGIVCSLDDVFPADSH